MCRAPTLGPQPLSLRARGHCAAPHTPRRDACWPLSGSQRPRRGPIFPSAQGWPFPGLRLTSGGCPCPEPHAAPSASSVQVASSLGLSVTACQRMPAPHGYCEYKGGGRLAGCRRQCHSHLIGLLIHCNSEAWGPQGHSRAHQGHSLPSLTEKGKDGLEL